MTEERVLVIDAETKDVRGNLRMTEEGAQRVLQDIQEWLRRED